MSLEVACPEGHKLRVPENSAGKKIRCPKCNTIFAVDAEPAEIEIDEEVEIEPIRSKKKPKKRPEPEDSFAEASSSSNGLTLSPVHLAMLGVFWLLSLALAGVGGAMFGGGGNPIPGGEKSIVQNDPPESVQTGASTEPVSASVASDPPAAGEESKPVASAPGMEGIRGDFQALIGYFDKQQYRMFIHELIPDAAREMGRDAARLDDPSDRDLQQFAEIRMHWSLLRRMVCRHSIRTKPMWNYTM